MTRADLYKEIADYNSYSIGREEFKEYFERWYGDKPLNIYSDDYTFEEVNWTDEMEEEYEERTEIDWEEVDDDYYENMPCDDTGFCSSSCPYFYKCHG